MSNFERFVLSVGCSTCNVWMLVHLSGAAGARHGTVRRMLRGPKRNCGSENKSNMLLGGTFRSPLWDL
jgi:hypothetical protein